MQCYTIPVEVVLKVFGLDSPLPTHAPTTIHNRSPPSRLSSGWLFSQRVRIIMVPLISATPREGHLLQVAPAQKCLPTTLVPDPHPYIFSGSHPAGAAAFRTHCKTRAPWTGLKDTGSRWSAGCTLPQRVSLSTRRRSLRGVFPNVVRQEHWDPAPLVWDAP